MEARSPLAVLDLRKASYGSIGSDADTDLVDALISGETAAVLARRLLKDVWSYDGPARRRVTTDGLTDAAAMSVKGDLLLARPGPGSTENIWSRAPDGSLRKVTNGQYDTAPDFSPDGSSWLYVDYARSSIMMCATATNECRVLRHDALLPTWPRFSPDGLKVAYVRLGAVAQLIAFSVTDGKEWPLGGTHWQCIPVWSSTNKVWAFEGSAAGYAWVEKEVETGLRTGRRVQVTEDQSAVNDELECWPKGVDATSPFFRKLRVETEETTSILRLPRRVLAD
jgi:dipeptidyl aminopeptidase/acylaminoacyl peptidase